MDNQEKLVLKRRRGDIIESVQTTEELLRELQVAGVLSAEEVLCIQVGRTSERASGCWSTFC